MNGLSANTTYTASVWLKAGTETAVNLYLHTGYNDTGRVRRLDFGTKTLTSSWQRFSASITLAASGENQIELALQFPDSRDASYYFYLWGAQVETGSYTNSYIKTTSTPASGPDTWMDAGGGIYTKAAVSTQILFEDNVALKKASSAACSDGNWYQDGTDTGTLYYKPTSGTASDHTVDRTRYVSNGFISYDHSYLTFENLTIQKAYNAFLLGSFNPGGQSFSNIIVQNNTVTKCRSGIEFWVDVSKYGSALQMLNNSISYTHHIP